MTSYTVSLCECQDWLTLPLVTVANIYILSPLSTFIICAKTGLGDRECVVHVSGLIVNDLFPVDNKGLWAPSPYLVLRVGEDSVATPPVEEHGFVARDLAFEFTLPSSGALAYSELQVSLYYKSASRLSNTLGDFLLGTSPSPHPPFCVSSQLYSHILFLLLLCCCSFVTFTTPIATALIGLLLELLLLLLCSCLMPVLCYRLYCSCSPGTFGNTQGDYRVGTLYVDLSSLRLAPIEGAVYFFDCFDKAEADSTNDESHNEKESTNSSSEIDRQRKINRRRDSVAIPVNTCFVLCPRIFSPNLPTITP